MHKSVQALVAVACIVIIVAGGWWMKIQSDTAKADAEMAATAEFVRRAEIVALHKAAQAEKDQRADECKEALLAYDTNGTTFFFVQRATAKGRLTGDTMVAEVQRCRDMIGG